MENFSVFINAFHCWSHYLPKHTYTHVCGKVKTIFYAQLPDNDAMIAFLQWSKKWSDLLNRISRMRKKMGKELERISSKRAVALVEISLLSLTIFSFFFSFYSILTLILCAQLHKCTRYAILKWIRILN